MDEQTPEAVVGRRIREERERAGRNLENLATAIGISNSHLSRIERGQRGLDSLVLRRIADELGVAMERFFLPCSVECVHARQGSGEQRAMSRMINWGRQVQDDLAFVLREGRKHAD
jgi:transcriptional regulator with XRE-family HTH domain